VKYILFFAICCSISVTLWHRHPNPTSNPNTKTPTPSLLMVIIPDNSNYTYKTTKTHIYCFTLVEELSIVMSMFHVCVCVCLPLSWAFLRTACLTFTTLFCACYLWPWLGSPLASLRYVVYLILSIYNFLCVRRNILFSASRLLR